MRTVPRSLPVLVALTMACATNPPGSPTPAAAGARDTTRATMSFERPQYPSTYQRRANTPVLIRNANVFTAAGPELHGTNVLFADGKVVAKL